MTEREPDEVTLGNCCPDPQQQAGDEAVAQASVLADMVEVLDPHLPERAEAVAIARSIYLTNASVGPSLTNASDGSSHLPIAWHGEMTVEKYRAGESEPYEVVKSGPNLLVDAGIQYVLDRIISTGTFFSNANARIAVGNSSTAPAAAQTDLQGASTLRKAMDATFPSRSGNVLTFKSTFATGDANFAWNEWCLANSASGATILNRTVQGFGTKTSADTWVATATVTLSGS